MTKFIYTAFSFCLVLYTWQNTLKSTSTSRRSSSPLRWPYFSQYHFQSVTINLCSLDTLILCLSSVLYLQLIISICRLARQLIMMMWMFSFSAQSGQTILQVVLKASFSFSIGPSLWRANPVYAAIKEYRQKLVNKLTSFYGREIASSSQPQQRLQNLMKSSISISLVILADNVQIGANNQLLLYKKKPLATAAPRFSIRYLFVLC